MAGSIVPSITEWLAETARQRGPKALMPTVAEVCDEFEISGVQTVRDAYQPLMDAGYIERPNSPRRWRVVTPPPAPSMTENAYDDLRDLIKETREEIRSAERRLAQMAAIIDKR